ncbi:tubulin alpha-3 chain isoform X2 [Halyomorpha halys]|nr:tubulin alpha-3 chain isoform X2 [Halyomorpha halys]
MGQAGVQMGNAIWELFCMEHLIYPDGRLADPAEEGHNVLFYETPSGQVVPRVVFADLEPTCIDEIRIGAYRQLFGPESMITGKEDAASNFARGYYSVGNEMSELCCERIRRQSEKCNRVQGFIIFRSFGGGTGSGLGANVISKIQRDFDRTAIVEFCVYPSPRISPIIVEPYNAVLTTHSTINSGSCTFFFDNQSIYDMCNEHLNVQEPTYTSLNRLVAQVVSGVTSSLRFPGSLTMQLLDFQTNLIPFPRIHFPLVSFAPIMPPSQVAYEPISTLQLIKAAFQPNHQMIKIDPKDGNYMACSIFLRGDVPPNDVNNAIGQMKSVRDVKFVEYSPSGFKVGHCYPPMLFVPGGELAGSPRSLVMVSNHSAIGTAWARLNSKYDLMFSKRAFVHHYVGEGMEEIEFHEAQADLKQLEEDYKIAGT